MPKKKNNVFHVKLINLQKTELCIFLMIIKMHVKFPTEISACLCNGTSVLSKLTGLDYLNK